MRLRRRCSPSSAAYSRAAGLAGAERRRPPAAKSPRSRCWESARRQLDRLHRPQDACGILVELAYLGVTTAVRPWSRAAPPARPHARIRVPGLRKGPSHPRLNYRFADALTTLDRLPGARRGYGPTLSERLALAAAAGCLGIGRLVWSGDANGLWRHIPARRRIHRASKSEQLRSLMGIRALTVAACLLLAAMAAAETEAVLGKWEVSKETDLMDDSVLSVWASVQGNSSDLSLSVRCRENQTEVYVIWSSSDGFFGGEDPPVVEFRVGEGSRERSNLVLFNEQNSHVRE